MLKGIGRHLADPFLPRLRWTIPFGNGMNVLEDGGKHTFQGYNALREAAHAYPMHATNPLQQVGGPSPDITPLAVELSSTKVSLER